MELKIDPSVKAVLEFMQGNIATHKLIGVAQTVAELAPIFWRRHAQEPVEALELYNPPIEA